MHVQVSGSMYLWRVRPERRKRIRHRLVDFVVDSDLVRGLARVEDRVSYNESENISDATRGLADRDKNRQVGNRQARTARPRNIRRGEDPHDARHGERNGGLNRQNFRARMRAQDRRGVQHIGNDAHVINKGLFA